MLDSRTHAAVDLGVLAGLAATVLGTRSATVRRAAAAAVAGQAGAICLTDYEAGMSPRLSFPQHRQLDLLGGAAMALGAAALRSRSLFALGAVTIGTALFSDTHAHGAPDLLYHPLDVPKPFAPSVWLVDSEIGPGLPVRMTVVKLPNGELLLHSPTRLRNTLRQALEAIGPIRHLVAPNSAHWLFAKMWQDAIPLARTYAAPGLRERKQVRRAGLRVDEMLSDHSPAAWGDAFEQVVVPGGAGFREVVMFHRASRTLMMTDLMMNLEPSKLPWLLRPLVTLLGSTSPISRAPAHLRAVIRAGGGAKAEAARRIVAWRPERVVVTHGAPVTAGAAERVQQSLRWLTG